MGCEIFNKGLAARIKKDYLLKKNKITARIKDFSSVSKNGNDRDLFIELVFCILTPQSKAKVCWMAVESLLKNEVLWKGTQAQIVNELNGVRFKYKKAKYIIEAREKFFNRIPLKSTLDGFPDNIETRDYIVENIKGIGYKEASHFLRNIGKGQNLAILDRHILKNLVIYDVIKSFPGSITKNRYFEIEEKMIKFSDKINIPVSHLDLLFWSKETGEIFK